MSDKKFTPVIDRKHSVGVGGTQKIYRFPNGLGASVVRFHGSYGGESGLWELAVITFSGKSNEEFTLNYSTPITDDVLGYLSESDVNAALAQIESLTVTS